MTLSSMTPKKTAAYALALTLLAAWFASALGVPPQRPPRRPPPAGDEARLETLARDVQLQSSRLRQRLASAPTVQAPARNPFSFGAREIHRRPAAARADAASLAAERAPEPEPLPREPSFALIGVAEQRVADGLTRTAMIAEDGVVMHMVTEGERVAGRYLVKTIGVDAVELTDETTGLTRRLVLR